MHLNEKGKYIDIQAEGCMWQRLSEQHIYILPTKRIVIYETAPKEDFFFFFVRIYSTRFIEVKGKSTRRHRWEKVQNTWGACQNRNIIHISNLCESDDLLEYKSACRRGRAGHVKLQENVREAILVVCSIACFYAKFIKRNERGVQIFSVGSENYERVVLLFEFRNSLSSSDCYDNVSSDISTLYVTQGVYRVRVLQSEVSRNVVIDVFQNFVFILYK